MEKRFRNNALEGDNPQKSFYIISVQFTDTFSNTFLSSKRDFILCNLSEFFFLSKGIHIRKISEILAKGDNFIVMK
jgi:hypothetical protein